VRDDAGLASCLAPHTTDQQWIDHRIPLAQTSGEEMRALVELHLALGGQF